MPLIKGKVLNLFRQNNAVACITRFTHKSAINNYENIQFVKGGGAIRNLDKNSLGYRIWEVS